MNAIPEQEVVTFLKNNLKEWSLDKKAISRDFKFKTFVEAFSFMTAIALEAEKMDHHPEWSNVYNSVRINLNTHDAKGITKLDFDLAKIIDVIFKKYTS